ncbi:MAG: extracellular solute-binding protein, partial [Nocardioides sp.]
MKNHAIRPTPRRSRWRSLTALFVLSVAALSACGGDEGGGGESGDKVLRVAMGSPGEAQMAVWEQAATQYEEAHPGWDVELNFMDDDQYQTVGLPNLLKGRQAPDLYFEWVGDRLANRVADGVAADLSGYVDGPLAGIWNPGLFDQASVDGKVSLIPHMADVTTVLWYNKALYEANGQTAPATMDELLANCAAFDKQGIPTIALGNKDLWPAGNFFSMIASRVVGPEVYDATLKAEASFDDPAWVAAFAEIKKIADAGCVNDSAAAINDNEGAQLFFQGKAA